MSTTGSTRAGVLHLLPYDLSRGAQTYAREMRELLDEPARPHRTMTLFASPPVALHADESLEVPMGPLRRVGFDPRVLLRLRRALAARRPELVVAHGSEPFLYGALALPPGTKFVYYRIGVAHERLRNPLRRALYRLAARRTDLVAGVSAETLDDSHRVLGVPRNQLELVPNGRDPGRFLAGRAPSSRRVPRLVWVSHLTPHKRPGLFVEAVAELRRRGRDVDAMLVGDGEGPPGFESAAAAAGVKLLGRREDVPELLLDADVFCFTSEGENEGMPGVLIEAGLAGLPAVTTDVAGAKTVVADGETGLVVPVDDAHAFADALDRLVGDADLRAAMGRAARARCLQRFTLEASTARWREVITGLLGDPVVRH